MEHIVHFGITIDDDAIVERINENVEKQVRQFLKIFSKGKENNQYV